MAKRVFELARELNLTTKELLVKLKDVAVAVTSHMSTLEDTDEAKVRETLFGKKSDGAVEETRIRSTVIRRRRKVVSEDETQVSSEEAAPKETLSKTLVPTEAFLTAPAVEEAQQTSTGPIERETTPAVVQPLETIPMPGVEAAPEKLVHSIEPAKLSEEPTEPAAADAIEVQELASQEDEPSIPLSSVKQQSGDFEVQKARVKEEIEVAEPAAEETAGSSLEQQISEKPVKPKKAKKKITRETPARIIQLPISAPETESVIEKVVEQPPVEALDLRKPERFKPPSAKVDEFSPEGQARRKAEKAKSGVPIVIESELDMDRKKGKRGKKVAIPEEVAGKDKKFLKKKIAFRNKEVIEGAALYDVDKRNRKARKNLKVLNKITPDQKPQITVAKAIKRRIKIDDTIILSELAKRMGIKAADMIRTLMGMGVMVTVNQTIDFETAVLVAGEFDYEVERAAFEEDSIIKTQTDEPGNLLHRPPVVTIMGHVDHGKTSLLDVIRKTRVTATEAGGITQHIGAYNVRTDRGQIVFLDTPGHEAFTAMRARGAKITDLVVLVVAADDGVMPQTVEAINHAKASSVPILVAINKIDKPNALPDRVIRQLAEIGLAPEEWGGDTIFVQVSAKKNIGIDDLLEMILLQAEMLELRANPNRLATGHVIESKLDSGRGPVATVLVQGGTLRNGDSVVCGVHYGKIRAMLNDLGKQVSAAGPSTPVEIIGLSGVPLAGDEMVALESEKDAKQVSQHRIQRLRSQELAKSSRMSLEGLFEKMKTGEVKDLNLIIKADVDGSIEALRDSLIKLSNEEVKINVVHSATGTITESDISLAAVSNAIIIGFNVRPNTKVSDMAQEENVDVRLHNVIYDVIQEIKNAIVGMMASTFEERILGKAEVREIFHVPKVGTIAGCMVTDGKIERSQPARVIRDGVIRYEGKISSLRRYKDDAKEVNAGYECGISISNFNDIKLGDIIECYYMEEIKPELL